MTTETEGMVPEGKDGIPICSSAEDSGEERDIKKGVVDETTKDDCDSGENVSEVSVVDEYLKVKEIVARDFGERVWFITDVCLSVVATLLLEDITNPTGLNLIDSPSTEKTTVLSWFYDIEGITYKTDNFTPASFVSHSSNAKKQDLPEIDLLPRIQYKCIIVPELAPIFQKRQEDLIVSISILTRVFDGQGLETDSGSRGRRGYTGDYLFAWLGASTPLDFKVWNAMGKLGSRLLFLTVPQNDSNSDQIQTVLSGLRSERSYKLKVEECREAVHDFLVFLWRQTGGVRKVKQDKNGDDEELVKGVATVASFVARARSVVSVWKETNSDYNYNKPVIEYPYRLSSVLYNLARGHAIIQGRTNLNANDLKVIIAVGLSSMPYDRRQVLDSLLKKSTEEWTETNEIMGALSISKPTALGIMRSLQVLGLVEYDDPGRQQSHRIRLKPDFGWFLSEEFKNLRDGISVCTESRCKAN